MPLIFDVADHPWLQNANKAPNVSLGENVRAKLQQFTVMNKFKKKALKVRTFMLFLLCLVDTQGLSTFGF